MSTKVSAVMALYNTPYSLLEATINSVLNQTFPDFELIIVDDNSETEYKEFIDKFQDARIKYFKLEKNIGPGGARNFGIKQATGEYVAIIDSDDVYSENRFELQVNFLDNNKDISILGGSLVVSSSKRVLDLALEDKDVRVSMLFNSPLANPVVMFKREDLLSRNLFYSEELTFGEDYFLWINSAFAGLKMANLEDKLMVYTRRSNQLSKMKQQNQVEIVKNLYKYIFEKLNMPASEGEIELHYAIEINRYDKKTKLENIENWFDKIINHNRKTQFFDEEILTMKKKQAIEDFQKSANVIFKLKLGKTAFYIFKSPLKLSLTKWT